MQHRFVIVQEGWIAADDSVVLFQVQLISFLIIHVDDILVDVWPLIKHG